MVGTSTNNEWNSFHCSYLTTDIFKYARKVLFEYHGCIDLGVERYVN